MIPQQTSAKNIQEAVKIGCKDLIADQETLINELRDFLTRRIHFIFSVRTEGVTAETLIKDIFFP